MVVAHGKPETIAESGRQAIKNQWDTWRSTGRVHVVPRWVADTSWRDIAAEL